jgi:hypothetical protein
MKIYGFADAVKNKPNQSQFPQQQNEHNLLINKGL